MAAVPEGEGNPTVSMKDGNGMNVALDCYEKKTSSGARRGATQGNSQDMIIK